MCNTSVTVLVIFVKLFLNLMDVILLIGIQATGKSTFCRSYFYDTHIRLNLDMLKTRHRETLLFKACIEAKQPFVVDNTNLTVEERARYIVPAKAAGFAITGYYFQSIVRDSVQRNEGRAERVPEKGILGAAGKLQRPTYAEGFDKLYYVRIAANDEFDIQEWNDEL